jgi:hypothetical protein
MALSPVVAFALQHSSTAVCRTRPGMVTRTDIRDGPRVRLRYIDINPPTSTSSSTALLKLETGRPSLIVSSGAENGSIFKSLVVGSSSLYAHATFRPLGLLRGSPSIQIACLPCLSLHLNSNSLTRRPLRSRPRPHPHPPHRCRHRRPSSPCHQPLRQRKTKTMLRSRPASRRRPWP